MSEPAAPAEPPAPSVTSPAPPPPPTPPPPPAPATGVSSVRDFYDDLAPDYHLIFPDWDASMARQAAALDGLVRGSLGPGPHTVLDCACGIGTQAIGLALAGHRVVGGDLSPLAVARATAEAAARGARLPVTVADMRRPPFAPAAFDAVVCADNALPHLLTARDAGAALGGMRRVLRDDGLLVLSVRDYDRVRETRPAATPVQAVRTSESGRVIGFQLWHWHDDGEHYDVEHFQLVDGDGGGDWRVRARRTTYWALPRALLTRLAADAGFTDLTWHEPDTVGFFQPVLTARRAGPAR